MCVTVFRWLMRAASFESECTYSLGLVMVTVTVRECSYLNCMCCTYFCKQLFLFNSFNLGYVLVSASQVWVLP